jgi:hypothetical protein
MEDLRLVRTRSLDKRKPLQLRTLQREAEQLANPLMKLR